MAIPLSTFSAILYGIISNWTIFISNPFDAILNWNGDSGIYGAIIGLLLSALLCSKIYKVQTLKLLDIITPGLAIALALGKCIDFFIGQNYGMIVESPGRCFFPVSVYAPSLSGWLYEVFFYESLLCLAIFIFLLLPKRKSKVQGDHFLWLLMLYSTGRIVFESMRADSIYIGFVKIDEIVSILILLFVLLLFSFRSIKKRTLKLIDIVNYLLTISAIIVAFLMEFYMGQATYLRNTLILAISVIVITTISIRFYLSDS